MAKAPTKAQVVRLRATTMLKEAVKKVQQKRQGRDFVNNGQGVIPEKVWKNLQGRKNNG